MGDVGELPAAWLQWLEVNKGRSPATIAQYRMHLRRLHEWLDGRGSSLAEAGLAELEEFSGAEAHRRGLSPRSRRGLVAAIRGFYGWMLRTGRVMEDPAALLEYPKAGFRLPRAATLHGAEKLLMAPDMSTFLGVRDAAILAVMIGIGPRLSGLVGMNESSLVWSRDEDGRERLLVRLREKGDKERLIPAPGVVRLYVRAYLGHEALDGIDRTLEDGDRVLWVSTANQKVPPHDYRGEHRRLARRSVQDLVARHAKRAGLPPDQRHPHALRHLFGTELAEDARAPEMRRELMGHADTRAGEVYVKLASRSMADVMDQSSPITKIRTPLTELQRRLDAQRD